MWLFNILKTDFFKGKPVVGEKETSYQEEEEEEEKKNQWEKKKKFENCKFSRKRKKTHKFFGKKNKNKK